MDTNKMKAMRQRLSSEYENLIKSIKRNRLAAEEIRLENTEDEGDLATISHDRDVLYNLHEGGFALLRSIQQAIKAIDCDQYGECMHCDEPINEKRLDAVPWALMCLRCQQQVETERSSSRLLPSDLEAEETLP